MRFRRVAAPGPLMQAIAESDNLTRAWQRVKRNIRIAQRDRSRGIDAVTISAFEAEWEEQRETLREELLMGQYRPLPPRTLLLPKRTGGTRTIAILAVRDRVAQCAVKQVLEPLFEPAFQPCSYGCRPHVGAPHALAQVAQERTGGRAWVAHGDVAAFFDRIDHRQLLALVRRQVKEPAVLQLISTWLRMGGLATGPGTRDLDGWWEQGAGLLEQALDWGTAAVARQVDPSAGPPAGIDMDDLGEESDAEGWLDSRVVQIRQRAWHGLAGQAALLGLAYARPALAALRRAGPLVLPRLQHPLVVAGAGLGAATLAAGPVVWRRWRPAAGRGTVQGGALSPLLANIYLDPFDRAMSARGFTLVRYVDDFVLLGATRAEVEAALAEARTQLARLHLEMHEAKCYIRDPCEALAFLGQTLPPARSQAPGARPRQVVTDQAARVAAAARRGGSRMIGRLRRTGAGLALAPPTAGGAPPPVAAASED